MRKVLNINKGWRFIKENVELSEALLKKGTKVNLPHTWNNLDGQDGGNDYVRDMFWYVKKLELPKEAFENEVYVEFLAVSQIADVYLNGEKLFHHEGGFSTFRVNLTEHLRKDGENVLAVSADNRPNEITYPQFADFTFFGGIYRDVNIIIVPKSHIDLDYFGSDGVMVTPKVNDDGTADIEVRTFITNPVEGQTIAVHIEDYALPESVIDETHPVEETTFELLMQRPILWQGRKNPHLYTCTVSLLDGDRVLDRKTVKFGVRKYVMDPNEGFILNGEKTPLRGVCRHQDRFNMGWAITNKEHEEDCALIAEMGANTIRLAHYQQAQYMYDLCDMYGFAIWVEIPFISRFMATGEENTISQMKELIIQSYNHPSIVCWGLSNEITMQGDDDPKLIENHIKLNDLCHELDPTRVTTMAQVSMLDIDSKMNEISDIFSYNIYYGWYVGTIEDNGPFLDECHKAHPNKCLGISEYGCEAILKWHSDKPSQGDYTEEYQAMYHEGLIKTIKERDYLWATHVWNMFDFAVDMRDEGGCKGRNNKGLVTFDRKTRKDSFYAYKAWLNKEDKFVHLCGKRYVNRHEDVTKIKVYSNLPEVTLKVNGKTVETKTGDMFFEFDVKLKNGLNTVTAVSGSYKDKMTLKKVKEPDKSYSFEGKKNAVTNWFDKDGNEIKLDRPEGYFSVHDKIKDIMNSEEAGPVLRAMINKMFESAGGDDARMSMVKDPESMLKMVGQFTIVRIASMGGDAIPKEAIAALNKTLNQIKKPEKKK